MFKFIVSESEMEDHKELFYMKLLEYEENLPKHYDKEKFVLSGLRYEVILNCLDKEKGHKTEEGATFKHWAKNNFRKTTSVNNIYWINCMSYNNSTYIGDQKTSDAALI